MPLVKPGINERIQFIRLLLLATFWRRKKPMLKMALKIAQCIYAVCFARLIWKCQRQTYSQETPKVPLMPFFLLSSSTPAGSMQLACSAIASRPTVTSVRHIWCCLQDRARAPFCTNIGSWAACTVAVVRDYHARRCEPPLLQLPPTPLGPATNIAYMLQDLKMSTRATTAVLDWW